MRRVGEVFARITASNTCQHKGRILSFSQRQKMLVLTEIILGDVAEFVSVETAANIHTTNDGRIACCSLGNSVLVLAEHKCDVFAAVIDIDDGALSASTIHISELSVVWDGSWSLNPFLCQLSSTCALLTFSDKRLMWRCDLKATAIEMTLLPATAPTSWGFSTLPILLPDGRLLVAGAKPCSTDITLISMGEELRFERAGSMPGDKRWGTSAVLVGDRFVIGFGGEYTRFLGDLWVFDLQTRESFPVRQAGEWHLPGCWVFLTVHHSTLYLIGGSNGSCHAAITSFPLLTLARLARGGIGVLAFSAALGLSPRLRSELGAKDFIVFPPVCL